MRRYTKMMIERMKKTAGEAVTAAIVTTAILMTALSTTVQYVVNRAVSSPERVQASVRDIERDISDIKSVNEVQNARISSLEKSMDEQKGNIEYIRRSVEEMNRRNGIVIK